MKKSHEKMRRKIVSKCIAGAVTIAAIYSVCTVDGIFPDLAEPMNVFALTQESESETQKNTSDEDASKIKNQNKEKNENKSAETKTETESNTDQNEDTDIEYVKLSEVPDIQWLLHLLKQIRISYGSSVFTSDYLQQNGNVIARLVGNPGCVCFSDYDIEQPIEYYSNPESAEDPRGYLNDRYSGRWLVTIPETSVVWVAENILHFDAPAIDSWTREESYFYQQDGTYYAFYGGIGDDFRTPEIVGVTRQGDRYFIYYNYVVEESMGAYSAQFPTRGFIMEAAYEEVDGHYYWTVYQETELGYETTAEEVYQDKASEYAPTSCKFDYTQIDHEAHLSESKSDTGTAKSGSTSTNKSASSTNKSSSSKSSSSTGKSSSSKSGSTSKSNTGSNTNIGTSTVSDDGFYGIWIGAWSNESSAIEQANQAKAAGYAGQVFMTTDWENLNANPYYVVTAGTYSSQSEAEAHLSDVQNKLIADAYIKHTGKRKSSGSTGGNSDVNANSSITDDASNVYENNNTSDSQGFYGIWIGAWSNESSAYEQASQATAAGYDGQVFMTTDWENLNPNPYYVVTAGTYSSQSEAEAYLSGVQNNVMPDAYIKYTGNHK